MNNGKRNSIQLAWLIRRHAIEMTHLSGGSHVGAVLSVADIMAVLYAEVLRVRPTEPAWPQRDRLIMSKGHAGAAVYAALAETGFFPVNELRTHYQNGSRLSGHVSHKLPGVELSTGSLGHGLSVATGMAYAACQDGRTDEHRVFAILGDGECDEGAVWEAALFAAHHRLRNLVAIVDRNQMQSLDFTENTLELGDFAAKWRAFGWDVRDIDGHDHHQLREALTSSHTRPLVVIANTIKGKGIPFMQHDILWHYRFPHDGWEYDEAVMALHQLRPAGVVDPYTPDGIQQPHHHSPTDDYGRDHTMTATWHPEHSVAPARRVHAPMEAER